MKKCWKLRLSRLLLLPLLFITVSTFAQYSKIEKGYYQFPIQPERTNYLAGNMGELRASHFHAGLDIKTNGVEGLNVYAAAEGYVSRIAVSTGGYGNAVYVVHPNGTTTVYAHLQRFNKELAKYVLESQYKQKSFTVNLFPDRGRFKLKKGEVLGYSGNSGSSTGPHLHFEIRDANQEVLDPLRIGFTEIKDKIAPIAERIALKTMNINSRVNGQFGRFEFNLEKRGNEYNSRHILITPKPTEQDIQNTSNLLDSLRTLILSDSITFASVAKQYSDDEGTKVNGGFLSGQFGSNKIPSDNLDPTMFFIIDEMKEGDISKPEIIDMPDGTKAAQIIYFKSKTKPHRANMTDDYEKLRAATLQMKKAQKRSEYIKEKMKEVYVMVDPEFNRCGITNDK